MRLMPLIEVVEEVSVVYLPYDPAERATWREEAAAKKKSVRAPTPTIDQITDVTGFLGRGKQTLFKRPKRHYLEWKVAQHLVEEQGYPPEKLVNEDYYVSWQVYQEAEDRDPKKPGTQLLRSVFHDGFFEAFDQFTRLNKDLFLNDKGVRRDPASLRVDLVGVHLDRRPERRREPACGFWEVKDAAVKRDKPENHETALLGFVQYMVKNHQELIRTYKWKIDVGFVVCHAQNSAPPADTFVESRFRVPTQWLDD
jgi:hypothetical protein